MITKKMLITVCDSIFAGDLSKVLEFINKFNSDGKNLIQILTQLMYFLRNNVVNYYVENLNSDYSIENMLKLIRIERVFTMGIFEKIFGLDKNEEEMIVAKTMDVDKATKELEEEIKDAIKDGF